MTKNDPSSIIQIARENGNSEDGLPLNLGLRVRELRKAKVLSTSQKNTVTIKPSRVRSSPLLFREGNQNAMPTSRVKQVV